MSSLKTFMVSHAVQSKVSSAPVVGVWNSHPIIFIHGYPMTFRGFAMLASKAILGDDIKMHPAWWEEVHAETAILCQSLPVSPCEGRDAFQVLQGIRAHINERKLADEGNYAEWVAEIEDKVAEAIKRE